MADRDNKQPLNLPGRFYVDDSCIDCDICRETAPQFFRRDDNVGASFVWQQPVGPEEYAEAEAAFESCPTTSIGSDG